MSLSSLRANVPGRRPGALSLLLGALSAGGIGDGVRPGWQPRAPGDAAKDEIRDDSARTAGRPSSFWRGARDLWGREAAHGDPGSVLHARRRCWGTDRGHPNRDPPAPITPSISTTSWTIGRRAAWGPCGFLHTRSRCDGTTTLSSSSPCGTQRASGSPAVTRPILTKAYLGTAVERTLKELLGRAG